MKLNAKSGPRTNRNILRRGGTRTIPDPALHGSGRSRLTLLRLHVMGGEIGGEKKEIYTCTHEKY